MEIDDSSNYYILMLRIGMEHQKEGISYIKMLEILKGKYNCDLTYLPQAPLQDWFYSNFYHDRVEIIRALELGSGETSGTRKYESHAGEPSFIKGDAVMRYIDYLELKEARESANKAHKIAIAAIIISGFLALSSIVFQIFQ